MQYIDYSKGVYRENQSHRQVASGKIQRLSSLGRTKDTTTRGVKMKDVALALVTLAILWGGSWLLAALAYSLQY